MQDNQKQVPANVVLVLNAPGTDKIKPASSYDQRRHSKGPENVAK